MERPADDRIDRIEKLRLDAVRAVVAKLHSVELVRPLDVELEQQLAGQRLSGRRWRSTGRVEEFVVRHRGRLSLLVFSLVEHFQQHSPPHPNVLHAERRLMGKLVRLLDGHCLQSAAVQPEHRKITTKWAVQDVRAVFDEAPLEISPRLPVPCGGDLDLLFPSRSVGLRCG
jgi:hypothetical protein